MRNTQREVHTNRTRQPNPHSNYQDFDDPAVLADLEQEVKTARENADASHAAALERLEQLRQWDEEQHRLAKEAKGS